MEDINLHFTGDIHAVGAAHDLAAAFLDSHLLHGNALAIDPATISWPRVLDVNDRALRRVRIGLGEPRGERESGVPHHGRLGGHGDPGARDRHRRPAHAHRARDRRGGRARATG